MIRSRLSIALVLFAAGLAPAQAQQAAGNEAVRARTHPYPAAIGALANYQSCGVHARADTLHALQRRFQAAEAAARAKGLGPALDDLRRGYEAMMAVADVMACGGGPAAALAGARNAIQAFEAWVAGQPPAVRAGAVQ